MTTTHGAVEDSGEWEVTHWQASKPSLWPVVKKVLITALCAWALGASILIAFLTLG